MNKLKKLSILLIVMSVFTTACDKEDKIEEKPQLEEKPNIDTSEEEKKIMEDFKNLIKPQTNSVEIGNYIRENIGSVSKENAEEMIKYLLIYQTETMEDFNNKIYETEYLSALNEDMGGILDKDKINNIKDEKVRQEYRALVDGFMTIVRYEETPVVETSWKDLKEYSSNIPKDFRDIVYVYDKFQNYRYDRDRLDVDEISKDLVKVEEIIKKNEEPLIQWKANEVYSLGLGILLIGPEGEYLEIWKDKNSDQYKDIMEVKNRYKGTELSTLISDIENIKIDEIMEVLDMIDKKTQFGLKEDHYLENVESKKDNNSYKILQLRLEDNKEKEEKINKMIKENTDDFVEKLNLNKNFDLTLYSSTQNKRYISYSGFINYTEAEGDYRDISFHRSLDYIQEKYVDIEEYLGVSFDRLENDLEKVAKAKFKEVPDFEITVDGLNLYLKENKDEEKYLHLNYKDLLPYLSFEELISGR